MKRVRETSGFQVRRGLAALSDSVPSPFGHNDKYVINNTYSLVRTQIKLWENFPQTHPDLHNMKKISSDPLDLGGSQEKIYLSNQFGMDLRKFSVQ